MTAQTIQIDSIFTTDGEIFPFEPDDTIYGLSISGSVNLNSDTSLVRVILTDEEGHEWMVYEAYPMILPGKFCEMEFVSDETKYLQVDSPYFLEIQIIQASIYIESIDLEDDYSENLETLQSDYKDFIESRKVDSINFYIALQNWNWEADTTPFSNQYYFQKKIVFGHRYNALGIDYYNGGIFISHRLINPSTDESEMVKSFDWREKHDANIENSKYWDHNLDKHWTGLEWVQEVNGWMTKIQDQGSTSACAVFSSIACLEAMINLYFNHHVDSTFRLNLSERQVYNCTPYNTQSVGCNTTIGKSPEDVYNFLKVEGVIPERCYPWESPYCDGIYATCDQNEFLYAICEVHDTIILISNFEELTLAYEQNKAAYLKQCLIEKGPLTITLNEGVVTQNVAHAVSLVGFFTEPETGIINWIIKNSWGFTQDGKGYLILPLDLNTQLHHRFYAITTPIYTQPQNYFYQHKFDKDNDGYCNWGIGVKPEGWDPPCGIDLPDWNDNQNRVGPCDANYYGQPVKPEMEVSIGEPMTSPDPVHNHGFYFFQDDNCTLIVTIANPGNAQLNLSALNTVTLEQGEEDNYTWNIEQLERQICMGNSTSFEIHFDAEETGETWIATVRINLDPSDFDVFEYFEFQLVYNGCNISGEDHFVTGYESWIGYNLVPNDIYIQRGGTLEVFGSLAMFDESDIFVDAGGELIVNGGLITNSCQDLWNGIDVWGNPDSAQMTIHQGMVSIINGACIEYAVNGIETGSLPEPRRYPSGGIVSCSDGVFKDNVTDVLFYPYTNTHPVTHEILPNFSRFRRTHFETTDGLHEVTGSIPYSHILMDNVEGIQFKGCTFENSSDQPGGERGKGIESYAAGYYVISACAEDIYPCPGELACRFKNLDYGIRAFNTNSYYSITVDSADFINNLRGIHLSLFEHPTIIKNTFEIDDPEGYWDGESLVGLYLDEYTTGYLVEENSFTGPSTISSATGIHLLNTGTLPNEIYNNSFITLGQGITAVGENRNEAEETGLCIKCNVFTGCKNDVYVTYETDEYGHPIITENTGIARYQGDDGDGDPTLGAGNEFSDVTSKNYINDTDCGHIDYTYQGFNPPDNIIPDYSGDVMLHPDNDARYLRDVSCPSHLGGSIIPNLEKGSLLTESLLIEAYNDTLLMVIDGGNTEGLNYDVITSVPEEALVLRQNLIAESPYLSDTVMISAIETEDVLPAAMIRDILIVNPQAPKSSEVMDALNQRQDTIPDYMMQEILQGLNTYGAKELLEQNLGNHITKRDMAWNNLNMYYKKDTANSGAACDSLIALYQSENELYAKYNLAFIYLSHADSSNIFSTLDSIPLEFDLYAEEITVHDQYMDLLNILWELRSDTTELDSIQAEFLFSIYSANHSLPGIYASNILIKERLMNYIEPVYLASPLKSDPLPDKKPGLKTNQNWLSAFPNPAGDYFIAEYDLRKFHMQGILTISDIQGKELKAIPLKDQQNQIVIPVSDFSAGLYVVKLYSGNSMVDLQKITLTR